MFLFLSFYFPLLLSLAIAGVIWRPLPRPFSISSSLLCPCLVPLFLLCFRYTETTLCPIRTLLYFRLLFLAFLSRLCLVTFFPSPSLSSSCMCTATLHLDTSNVVNCCSLSVTHSSGCLLCEQLFLSLFK